MNEDDKTIVYKYPPQIGIDNCLTVACGSEGFNVTGHSNEISFQELEARIMGIVAEVAGKMKDEPKNYHG